MDRESAAKEFFASRLFLAAGLVLRQGAVMIMQPQHIASDDAITVQTKVTCCSLQDFSAADIPGIQSQQHGVDAESVELGQAGIEASV